MPESLDKSAAFCARRGAIERAECSTLLEFHSRAPSDPQESRVRCRSRALSRLRSLNRVHITDSAMLPTRYDINPFWSAMIL